jgi:hypothetical protein
MSSVSKTHNKLILGIIITAICIPLLVVLIFLALLFSAPSRAVRTADAGFEKAKKTINPEELRAWALESVKHWAKTNGESSILPRSEIPEYIRNLYPYPPEDVEITGGEQAQVAIMWGGGFFHWGLFIGDTNFSLPFNSRNMEYPYNFKWVNGIYYTREANMKLK